MRTAATDMFGIDVPIFAFSHCRDVVVEVSRAGGLGVLGCAYHAPEQLRAELKWIVDHIDGKPFGIDIMLPGTYRSIPEQSIRSADLPPEPIEYLRRYLDEAGIPRLPEAEGAAMIQAEVGKIQMTREQAAGLLDVAMEYPIKLVVNALGVPPRAMVDDLHARGIKVGALVGKPEHATRQKAAGVDIIVAQGMEAGGHTGDITSMVLWPQVVDAVAPIPVLAAGGIGRGKQMAAALALGADGIWCGSIWLTSAESEISPQMKRRLLAARSEDAIQSKARTGKQCRLLDSKLIAAWRQPDAPPYQPMPFQTAVMAESRLRVERAGALDWLSYPVGQIVGDMNEELTVRQIVYGLIDEFLDAGDRLHRVVSED